MLEKILNNFSLNSLKVLAGSDSLKFFEETLNISPDYYESNSQITLLIQAILNSNPITIFLNTVSRNYFIDRMHKNDISYVIEKINGKRSEIINSEHYNAIKEFCNNNRNLSIFLDSINCQGSDLPLNYSNSDLIQDSARSEYIAFKSIKPKYGLYPYQVEISEKTYYSLETGSNNRAVIHLPTGAGKTRTAMHIICRHLMTQKNALVLWLANSDILCEQAAEEFEEAWSFLGNREILQGRFYKSNDFSLDSINSGFVVGGLQKLHSRYTLLSNSSASSFDRKLTLVVFDEAHKALASTYKELVDRFLEFSPQAKLIGLTATPGRIYKDDKPELEPANKALAQMFGNNKITMDVSPLQPMDYLIDNHYLAKPHFIELKYDDSDLYENLSANDVTETELMSRLGVSKNRNSIIIQTILNETKKNKAKIIVFACDIEHARNIAFSLCCLGIKAASVDSKYTSQQEKESIIHQYKYGDLSVLVNCEMLTTGFDAPETNVAIIARPTQSLVLYLQMIGRALRGNTDQSPKSANIYTVLDEISDFNNVNLAFKHWNEMWTELEPTNK
ncbi:DEAD/DEAH box helicase [Colwellia sp. C1TZA3]|uniref:DEAD/DEAH box helicase n=1 Tax=Colwellia sp. C1TZA3 TaxID=2508879 RepID=UPI0011BA1E28|nr:DEAD/DEAH box helicase [Colwellia sp. C1TZA3]TWX72205.1 DEAD/DEAH box helicase [Colwellia sp. C1TZA3]